LYSTFNIQFQLTPHLSEEHQQSMGIEDILQEAAAEHENEYGDEFEDFEEETEGISIKMSLKKAAQIVDKDNEYDARESLKSVSKARHNKTTNSSRNDEDYSDTIADKMKKADAKTGILPTKISTNEEEKTDESDIESSDGDEDDEYDDSQDFMFCCYRRRIDDMYRHLERGASIRSVDRHGWTTVHWACCKGYDDVLEVLLKEYRGGERNIKKCINQKDTLMGFTPLHLACVGGHVECIRILFDYKVKKIKNIVGELPIDVMSESMSSAAGKKIAKLFGIEVFNESKSGRK
jgi:ankyrin repeat protein